MTVEEKRKRIKDYCLGRECTECRLFDLDEYGRGCYGETVDDETVERNYALLFMHEIEETLDTVNHPAHYTDGKIEVIDYIEDKRLGFCLGNAVKYISRAGKKDPDKEIEDLNKAKWYIVRRIKELKEGIT